jgi:hypothetical protein
MKYFLYLFFTLCAGMSLYAQNVLPQFFDNGNAGTEFYLTFLPAWPVDGGINDIKIYISSAVETEVTIEIKEDNFTRKKITKPNDILEMVLPVTVAQPYFKTDKDPTPKDAVYRQKAVHVTSKDPIIVYGLISYQYSSEGFLGIPVSALGKEYIIASSADAGDNGTSFGQYLPSQVGIIAAFDNTRVAFTVGGNLATKTAGGIKVGETKVWSLNKGDVLSLASFGTGADLSGSKIEADKPVAVISGNYCAHIPDPTTQSCNTIVEMEIPTYAWGKEYVVTKVFGRQNSSPVKIMAKEPNTNVYCNGEHIATISTAGGIKDVGYISRRLSEDALRNFVVTADKPICITQFNPGETDDAIMSSPFQLVLTPVDRFIKDIALTTPGIGDGSGFGSNYVNIVFELDENGEIPSDLEFISLPTGQDVWESVSTRFGFMFEPAPVEVNGKQYGIKTIRLPQEGRYSFRCLSPMAIYCYGFSDYAAYAYPAAASYTDRSGEIDTLPPNPAYVLSSVGSVGNGVIVDANPGWNSNLASVTFMTAMSFNYNVSHVPFIPGDASITTWNANVIDESKPARAVITFIDRAGNDTTITLEYSGIGTSVEENDGAMLSLHGFLPNPAPQQTVLHYSLAVPGSVRLALYNLLGEEVRVINNDVPQAGLNTLAIYTGDLPAGMYMCRLTSGNATVSGRLVIER